MASDIFDQVASGGDIFDKVSKPGALKEIAPGFAREANIWVGSGLKGLSQMGETPDVTRTPSDEYPGMDKLSLAPPKIDRDNALYKAGKYISETGEQIPPAQTFTGKAAESVGGLVGLAATGEAAVPAMATAAYGQTLDDQYEQNKKKGLSDEEATRDAINKAGVRGVTEAAVWGLLPRPAKALINKVTGNIGAEGVKAFLLRRVAGATEMGALSGISQSAQNVEGDRPITDKLGPAIAGGGIMGAFLPQPGVRFKPKEVVPPEVKQPTRQLGQGITKWVTPEGTVIDISQMSESERREAVRSANAESRQTESGQERVYNTVDAALRHTDEPVKDLVNFQGADYYKRGNLWVTDKPSSSLQRPVLRPGRTVTEDAVIRELEARLKESKRLAGTSETQEKIDDLTGVSREKSKVGQVAPELVAREEWEKKVNQRFASPKEEYGPNGALSLRQGQRLKSFSDYLRKAPLDQIGRLYHSLTGTGQRIIPKEGGGFTFGQPGVRSFRHDPKYPYDIEIMRMLRERLGIPEVPTEQPKLPGEQLKQLGAGEQPPGPQAPPKKPTEPVVAGEDEKVAFESNKSLLERTGIPERDAAFAARAKALKQVAMSLKSGDVVIDEDGERHVVSQMAKDGTLFVHPEDATGPERIGREFHLAPEMKIERTKGKESSVAASGETPLTADAALSKPPGEVSPDHIAAMSDEELVKLTNAKDENGIRKFRVQEQGILWGAKQGVDALPDMESKAKAAQQSMLGAMMDPKRAAEIPALQQRAQFFASAAEGIRGANGVEGKGTVATYNTLVKEGKIKPKEPPTDEPPPAAPVPKEPVTPPVAPPAASAPDKFGDEPSIVKPVAAPSPVHERLHGLLRDKLALKPQFLLDHTEQEAIAQIDRGILHGKDPKEIEKAISTSRNYNGFLGKLSLIDSKNRKFGTDEIKEPVPKTPEQAEQRSWEDAWSSRQMAIRRLREGTDADGKSLTTELLNIYHDILRPDSEENKIIAAMKEKYGHPDPGKHYKSDLPNPTEKPAEPSQRLNHGDKVTRTVEGKEQTGTVQQTGGRLQVVYGPPERPLIEPLSGDWKRAEVKPSQPVAPEPYDREQFSKDIIEASKLKRKERLPGLEKALDIKAPGLVKTVHDAIVKLRESVAKAGLSMDDPEAAREKGIENDLVNTLAGALKVQDSVNRGHTNYSQEQANEDVERVTRWLKNAEKAVNERAPGEGWKAKAERLIKNLEKLKDPMDPGLNSFGLLPAAWNKAIEMVQSQIREGISAGEAIEKAIEYLRKNAKGRWNELGARRALKNSLTTEKVADAYKAARDKTPPVVSDFAKDTVEPVVGGGYNAIKAAYNMIVNTFTPASRARPGDVDILFDQKGKLEQAKTQAAAAFDKMKGAFDRMTTDQSIAFIDRIKTGQPQPTKALQEYADMLRRWDDQLYNSAKEFKPDLSYLDNHYRVLWETLPGAKGLSGKALEQFLSKRPWRGSRGFLLQHTLADMSEGIARGGVPVSYNPVDMFLLHHQDVMKFVTVNRAWEALKKSGAVEFVKIGESPPPGFVHINDAIAKPYFRAGTGTLAKQGEWFVEPGAAQMIDNYLSRDYIRQGSEKHPEFGAVGKALLSLKNASTFVELSVSPFHAAFVTNEAVGSALGQSISKMFTKGKFVEGAREFAESLPGTVPVVGAMIPGTTVPKVFKLGGQIAEYAKNPTEFKAKNPDAYAALSKQFPEFDRMVNDLFSGGGQIGMDESYKTGALKGFREAMKKSSYLDAMVRAVPALNQKILNPIFQSYIPRLKLGMWAREYAFELDQKQKELESGKVTRGQLARERWALIEDRFGELNWDNLYWNRTMKSAMQLAFRSVTWKLGNLRAFGKAGRDLVQEFGVDWWKEGRQPRITPPIAWLIGMAAVTAIQSTILSKVFTGKYPWELAKNSTDEIKNLTFPRISPTDESQRISVATYWKDLVHLVRNPVDYVHSSMTGEIGRAVDIWNNRDFYGTKVYNEDDPWLKQVKDKMEHMIPVPFSVSSFEAAKQSGATTPQRLTGFGGYTKAPYYISHSKAEVLAAELNRENLPQGGRTQAATEKSKKERNAVQAIRRGELTLDQAIDRGMVDERRYAEVDNEINSSHLQFQLRHMPIGNAMKVWEKSDKQERESIRESLRDKLDRNNTVTDEDRTRYERELEKP